MLSAVVFADRERRILDAEFLANTSAEIGRVLVGSIVDGKLLVALTIPAGPRALRSVDRFSPDWEWQQQMLSWIAARFPRCEYLGDIHAHPGGFDQPSSIDLRTARGIVSDRAWNRSEAVFPIVTVQGGQVRIRAYLMRRETLQFAEVAVETIDDNDPRLIAVLTGTDAPTKGDQGVQANASRCKPRGDRAGGIVRRAAGYLRRLSSRRRADPDPESKA